METASQEQATPQGTAHGAEPRAQPSSDAVSTLIASRDPRRIATFLRAHPELTNDVVWQMQSNMGNALTQAVLAQLRADHARVSDASLAATSAPEPGRSTSATERTATSPELTGRGANPMPLQDDRGVAQGMHANPTLADAIGAPAQVAAGHEARSTNVRVVAPRTAPVVTGPGVAPPQDQLYLEASSTPAPTGFTHVDGVSGTLEAPRVAQRMSSSLYIGNAPSPDDIQQGGIGDCYFQAMLMSIAQRDPGKIRSMMTPDGRGGATVTFWTKTTPRQPAARRGAAPPRAATPQYRQVSVHVSGALQYWQDGVATGQRFGNGQGGFQLLGSQLRADDHPAQSSWWTAVRAPDLEIHRDDEYDTGLWAPLMEKAFALFAQQHGQYGGSQDEPTSSGNPYEAINGGWPHQLAFAFYGPQADLNGANTGQEQQQSTTWAPGAQVLAQNPRVVDQLLLLQGRGERATDRDRDAPILTATSMVYLLIPRLAAAITAAQADDDWKNISVGEQVKVALVQAAISNHDALDDGTEAKSTAQAAIGTACAAAIDPSTATTLLAPTGRSRAVRQMTELLLDLKNIGTDHSPGQRNIYGDHVYSVVGVNFTTSTGTSVPLQAVASGMRPLLFPLIDTAVSQVTLRNPHHGNTPDPTGSGAGPDGPTGYPEAGGGGAPQASGIFHMSLEDFFVNFTSVESGVFPRS